MESEVRIVDVVLMSYYPDILCCQSIKLAFGFMITVFYIEMNLKMTFFWDFKRVVW
jgi:hypothetical protein